MKIPQRLIGKRVTIFWRDPRGMRVTSHDTHGHKDVPRGPAGLAYWEEEGVIEAVDDGVLMLVQSVASDPAGERDASHELQYSLVPEVLLDKIKIWPDQPVEEL